MWVVMRWSHGFETHLDLWRDFNGTRHNILIANSSERTLRIESSKAGSSKAGSSTAVVAVAAAAAATRHFW